MIVTREDASEGETETAIFTDERAGWAYAAYLLLDTVVRMERIPDFEFEKVLPLIQDGKHQEAVELALKESGPEVFSDIYIHIDLESPHHSLVDVEETMITPVLMELEKKLEVLGSIIEAMLNQCP